MNTAVYGAIASLIPFLLLLLPRTLTSKMRHTWPSLKEKLELDPDAEAGVSARYLLASLEADPGRLTKDDQVRSA